MDFTLVIYGCRKICFIGGHCIRPTGHCVQPVDHYLLSSPLFYLLRETG
jgi:hypothetical protein